MGKSKGKRKRPINSLINLEDRGYLSELDEYKSMLGLSIWKFRMGKLTFHLDNQTIDVDFTKYKIKIVFNPKKVSPKNIRVFIDNIKLPKNTKHIYADGSLCLFKYSNFIWTSDMTIEKDLFTTICTWLYHYQVWKRTGKWYGEEAEH